MELELFHVTNLNVLLTGASIVYFRLCIDIEPDKY